MKVAENPVEVVQSGQSQSIAMGFDEDSLRHLMSVLTELYSDPVMASIREYLTNAYDSHVEAGQTKPIMVARPTSFRKSFVIQDFGIGLSLEDLETIYSQYGASTKRDSNDVVGMLGLGCKSALAYTNQFFVTGVKDGKRVVGLITRDGDGSSTIEVLEHEATDEENGVRIEIPVDNTFDFNNKVTQFLYYWKPELAKVDGQDYTSIYDDEECIWLDDQTLIVKGTHAAQDGHKDVLVMGGVPYPMKRTEAVNLSNGYRVIHFAPIGSVDFTPSREELKYTPRTNKYMEWYDDYMKALIKRKVDELLKGAQNISDVVNLINPFGFSTEWKGLGLPQHNFKDNPSYSGSYSIRSGRAEAVGYSYNFRWDSHMKVMIISNYKPANFGIANYRKAYDYLNDGKTTPVARHSRVILFSDDDYPDALNEFDVVDWEEIKTWARKRGHIAGTGKVRTETYKIWNESLGQYEDRHTKDGEKYIIFTPANNAYGWQQFNVRNVALTIYPGYHVVCESKNRHAKFLRNNKGSKEFNKADIDTYIKKHIGPKEAVHLKFASSHKDFVQYLHLVNDPEVVEFLKNIKGDGVDSKAVKCYNELKNLYRYTGLPHNPKDLIQEKYPAAVDSYGLQVNQRIEVINALYAYRKDNK